MNKDLEKFEKLINESPLFDIPIDKELDRYNKESYKMIEYLYSYLIAQNSDENIEYGVEILETAKRCIKSFDKTKGIFLHYFNRSWKEERSHLLGEKIFNDKFKGIKFSEDNKRAIKRFMKYASKYDDITNIDDFYKLMSESLKITLDETIEIAKMVATQYIDNDIKDEEGHNISIFENIEDKNINYDILESNDNIESILDKLDDLYNDLQERQKPIVADMMTCDLADELMALSDTLLNHSFINKELLNSVKTTGKTPSQRDIAGKYGKDEASISRTMREFKRKLKNEL